MKPINKQALRNIGIRGATLETHDWGTYWFKDKPEFIEGHFDPIGNIYQWQGDNPTLSTPVQIG